MLPPIKCHVTRSSALQFTRSNPDRRNAIPFPKSLPASKSGCMSTPLAIPERSKKRVRLSDPRPETELESVSYLPGLYYLYVGQPSSHQRLQRVTIFHPQLFEFAVIMAYRYLGLYSLSRCDRCLTVGLPGGILQPLLLHRCIYRWIFCRYSKAQ